MNRIIYRAWLVIAILALTACNLNNPAGTPAAVAFPSISLTIQSQNPPDSLNAAGQTVNYAYTVTNTGTMPLAGPVTVTGDKAPGACPDLTSIGNLDAAFDPAETIVCSGAYTLTGADLTAGSVMNTATASAGGTSSSQANSVVTLSQNQALTLTRSADSTTYTNVGDTITFSYEIKNTGPSPLGPAQFVVNDDHVSAPINCGSSTTLEANGTVACSASYTIAQADIDTGSVTSSATASGGGAVVAQPVTTTLSKAADSGPQAVSLTNFTAGTTILHTVTQGEWLLQIARCYGADYWALRFANLWILNPNYIRPNTVVTVPNIGSRGKIYGPPCVVYHTVAAGDTWESIAQKYNADVAVLQAVNRGATLTAGTVLKVPINSAGTTNQPPPSGNQTLTVAKSGTGGGTVTSNPAGIDCGSDCSETYTYNTSVTLTATPNAGSVFSGWSGSCSGASPTCAVTMSAARYVTATFDASTFALTVTKSGSGAGTVTSQPAGIDCGSDCSETYPFNTQVTLTAAADAGSEFKGWSGACSGTTTCTITINAVQNVTATFDSTGNPILTVTKAGTGAGTVTSSPAGIDCGSDCSEPYPLNTPVTLTAAPASPSVFGGWSGGGCSGTSPTCIVTLSQSQSVTATFNPPDMQTLTVTKEGAGTGTVTSNPAGIDCGSDCSEPYALNTQVTLTANPTPPSTFAGWAGPCRDDLLTCVITMSQSQTITAAFDLPGKQRLTVAKAGTGTGTVTSNPAGIDCGGACAFDFDFNTAVTLTASPASGSGFTGWNGGCSGTAPCTIAMDQARNVTATFDASAPTLTVTKAGTGTGTVASQPAGIDCGTDCAFAFAPNTQVTLTASPAASSAFIGWSGACSGSGACVVTMDQARTVTAMFDTVEAQTLTVFPSGTGEGTVTSSPAGIDCGSTCASSFPFNTQVTLTATPANPFNAFGGWGGACSGNSPTCTVTMSEAKTVFAIFNPQ